MSTQCATLQNLGYGDFSEQLHRQLADRRFPISGSIELTMRCNLRCEHCYLPLSKRTAKGDDELSLSEFKQVFSELAEAGTLWLLLTGGEPLLRPDFLEIYDEAKRRGFILSLFTNGTMVDQRIADHLAEFRPFSIEISLYGATPQTYERVTGIPGSFTRCINGIELLLERKLPVKLKTILMTLNVNELDQMRQLADSYGLRYQFDPMINAGIDGSLYPTQFRLETDQIVDIEFQDADIRREWTQGYQELKVIDKDENQLFICGAGRKSFHIDSYGNLSACMVMRSPSYALRRGSFKDGWKNFIPNEVFSLKHHGEDECDGCPLRVYCGQCPAMGFVEYGNYEALVPFFCELAKKRYSVFTNEPECIRMTEVNCID